jgi:hypothetical protein
MSDSSDEYPELDAASSGEDRPLECEFPSLHVAGMACFRESGASRTRTWRILEMDLASHQLSVHPLSPRRAPPCISRTQQLRIQQHLFHVRPICQADIDMSWARGRRDPHTAASAPPPKYCTRVPFKHNSCHACCFAFWLSRTTGTDVCSNQVASCMLPKFGQC